MVFLEAVWGKLGKGTFPTDCHPLIAHLIDVGVVASELWKAVKESLKKKLADSCLLSIGEVESWVIFLIAAHDHRQGDTRIPVSG